MNGFESDSSIEVVQVATPAIAAKGSSNRRDLHIVEDSFSSDGSLSDDDITTSFKNLKLEKDEASSPHVVVSPTEDHSPHADAKCSDSEKPKAAEKDSAWAQDTQSDEFFLSERQFKVEGVKWPKLRIPSALYDRLYPHQRKGVQWMASLHSNHIGGILGDDMGLGKTYQTLTFLGGLMRAKTIRNALILMPVSLLRSWEKEAKVVIKCECLPNICIMVVSSGMERKKRRRELHRALRCSPRYPTIVMSSYELAANSTSDYLLEGSSWDYVVVDEGHRIKNPTAQKTKACHQICGDGTRRLMLTGTPIQNNLKELWALFDWACSGEILGNHVNFRGRFGDPIEAGRNKSATSHALRRAERANLELQALIRPHFLQRLKSEIMKDLPKKEELIVWTHLSPKQRILYEQYLGGEFVASVLMGDVNSPLEAVTWLKKLCGHPELVQPSHQDIMKVKPELLLEQSAKLQVLAQLISELSATGHRTLVFSQSTKILDMIQICLDGLIVSRIDGSVKEKQRHFLVEQFNNPHSDVDVMLLSTKAGGLGLTLTGADRAVIYDPSWNPAEDSQAVDRCYRIGQTREVKVYRFIAAGTVEEKMLEKQVHKEGLNRAVTSSTGNNTARYFDNHDLRKLFILGPEGECAMLRKVDSTEQFGVNEKPSFVGSCRGAIGVSSYDSIYKNASTKKNKSEFSGKALTNVVGRSQRAMKGIPRKSNGSASASARNDCGTNNKENVGDYRATSSKRRQKKIQKKSPSPSSMLIKAQGLRQIGKLDDSLEMALNLFDGQKDSLTKTERLQLHQLIAHTAEDLGFDWEAFA